MVTGIAERASKTVKEPEVQRLIEELSKHGLGVCVPHMHDEVTNELIPLPSNMVQTESNRQIAFVDRETVDDRQVPVAWLWDHELKSVQHCAVCQPPDGPHH